MNNILPAKPYRDYRFVRYAKDGKQVAIVRRITKGGLWVVQKWLEASQRWTSEVRVGVGDVLGPASEADWLARVRPGTDLEQRMPCR